MTTSHDRPHDRLAKDAFGSLAGARALLSFALPPEIRAQIDFSTLRLIPGNPIGSRLTEGFADLLFAVRCGAEDVFLHILVEHKSSAEPFTLLDLFESCGRIWRSWRRKNSDATRVPRILPIILHHGPRPWNAPRTVAELLAGDADHMRAAGILDPTLPVVLVDLALHPDAAFDGVAVLDAFAGAALWMLRWSRAIDFQERLIARADLLTRVFAAAGGPDHYHQLLHYAFTVGQGAVDFDLVADRLVEHLPRDAERIMKTMAEQLIERGEIRGLRKSIAGVLTARFGPLPVEVAEALARAEDPDTLQRWLETAATATSLKDVVRALTN